MVMRHTRELIGKCTPSQSTPSPPSQFIHSPPSQSTHSPPSQFIHSPPSQSTLTPPSQFTLSPPSIYSLATLSFTHTIYSLNAPCYLLPSDRKAAVLEKKGYDCSRHAHENRWCKRQGFVDVRILSMIISQLFLPLNYYYLSILLSSCPNRPCQCAHSINTSTYHTRTTPYTSPRITRYIH